MADFRLQVFYTAAKNLSFTKAAQELYISQPAVTRHINALEEQYQVLLFERQGNKLELTPAGKLMMEHSERILQQYQQLEYAMHLFHQDHVGQLRLGASTTIAQYVLPPHLAQFIADFPHATVTMLNGNTRFIEHELSCHNIDLGLIEGVSRSPLFTYTPFQDDELLVLASANSRYASTNTSLSLQEFCRAPLVLREHGSGTLEAIEKALHQQHITLGELNVSIYLGSTEAIKLFVKETDCLCILSKYAVTTELQNGTLRALQVENLCFKRQLCFVQAPGPQSPLVNRFIDFVCKRAQSPANGC